MPSLRVNLPHKRLGRVNVHFSTANPQVLRNAVGLTSAQEILDEEDRERQVSDGESLVPLVLKLDLDVESREQTLSELIAEEMAKADAMSSEPSAGDEAIQEGDRTVESAAEDSSSISSWSVTESNWLPQCLNNTETAGATGLSSDDPRSSTGTIPLLMRDSRQQGHSFDNVDPDIAEERARALAILGGVAEVPIIPYSKSGRLKLHEQAAALLRDTEDQTYYPNESEHVARERAQTHAILTGKIVPPPNRDYGLTGWLFRRWRQQDEAWQEAAWEMRDPRRVLHKPEQGLRRQDSPNVFGARWMQRHLSYHSEPLACSPLRAWHDGTTALLLEVEGDPEIPGDGCRCCDKLEVTAVTSLDDCSMERFRDLMERVALRGWRDIVWVLEYPMVDVPSRVDLVDRVERAEFDVLLM